MVDQEKVGTGDVVRKGLVMILSRVQGVTRTFEGIGEMRTGPFVVYFELGDSHPKKGEQLFYSIGYSVTEKSSRRYDLMDVLEIRAHAHETDASREFLRNFEAFITDTFPGAEPLRHELLETETAKRVYRWWLPVFEVIRFAACDAPDA